jgi:peroxiredoxin
MFTRVMVIIVICLGLILPLKIAGIFDTPRVPNNIKVDDYTPPKITDIKVANITHTTTGASTDITWKTDEPATSQVNYGLSSGYGTLQPSQTDTTMVSLHEVILYDLSLQTTYHFKVISRDAAGNEASSPDATFLTSPTAEPAIGDAAPDFTLQCADGSTVTLSNFRGRKVIINFWNIYIPACAEEMPFFQQIHEKHPNLPLLVIHDDFAMSRTALPEIIRTYLSDNKFTFTVPIDTVDITRVYNAYYVPKTYFLDSDGIIKKIQIGKFSSPGEIEFMLGSY